MIRRRIFAGGGEPQRASRSRKRSSTSGTSASQGFDEVFGLQSRDDSPTSGDRRSRRRDLRERLFASNAGVEHVRRWLFIRLYLDEIQKRPEHDLRTTVQAPPRCRRYTGQFATDRLERVFDE